MGGISDDELPFLHVQKAVSASFRGDKNSAGAQKWMELATIKTSHS